MGQIPIEEVVKIYGEAGFDAIAITDHLFDTQSPRSLELYDEGKSIKDLEGYFHKIEEVSRWAKESYDLLVIPGLEICNLLEDYHILGIDLKEGSQSESERRGCDRGHSSARRSCHCLSSSFETLILHAGRQDFDSEPSPSPLET